MILAQEKYAERYNFEQDKKKFSKRQKSSGKNNLKLLAVGIIVAFFSMGILLTAQYAKIAATGFQVLQLKQEVASLETTNQRLYLRTLQLQSLDRIEEIAVNNLGMVAVEPSVKQQLDVATSSTAMVSGYGSDNLPKNNVILVEQQGRQLNPIIQAISQIIK